MSDISKMTRRQRRAIERAARAGVKRKADLYMPDTAARLAHLDKLERFGVFSKEQADKLRDELGAVLNGKLLCGGCDE